MNNTLRNGFVVVAILVCASTIAYAIFSKRNAPPPCADLSCTADHSATEQKSTCTEEHDHSADLANTEADHAAEAGEASHAHANETPEEIARETALAASKSRSIALSPVARKNLRLEYAKLEVKPFEQTASVPGMVVERAGRSTFVVSALMNGSIERVYPLAGQTVQAGEPLFELRLTHEDLVRVQTEYLDTVFALDVIDQEVKRLEQAAEGGAIAGKTLLEKQYQQQRLSGTLAAQTQQLLLHGLTQEQIDSIRANRSLISHVTIYAPKDDENHSQVLSSSENSEKNNTEKSSSSVCWQVQSLDVSRGKHVLAGETLCVLSNHSQLYVEGKAFEQDFAVLERMFRDSVPFSAILETGMSGADQSREEISGLTIEYLANQIDPASRAFLFYAKLPNQMESERKDTSGHVFSTWKYRPGQRFELRIPILRRDDAIVLPADAIVQEGSETFVMVAEVPGATEPQNTTGEIVFDRHPAHLLYRDRFSAIVENDGELPLGRFVAARGSYQIYLAIRNQSGGAVDPHAGHNH